MPTPPRQDAAAFSRMTSKHPAVVALAESARALVIDVLPDVFEVVWLQQGNAGYGTGPKKQTEHFCWISPAKAHVSLGFNYGAELPDPKGLLEGTGKLFRHVKLRTEADVRAPALRKLLQSATKHRVPPPQNDEAAAKPKAKATAKAKKKTASTKAKR
jgi:hypothetical protein